MKERMEEFLCFALWVGCKVMRPTFRNLTDSFESWAYRYGMLGQIQRLERRKWIETRTTPRGDRLYRLTALGRLRALGGRDPEACWRRRWDGRWRMVVYDVPEAQGSVRNRLRRHLRHHGFGCLQQSVWITPHPVHEQQAALAAGPVEVGTLLFLEARPGAGESDAALVNRAWDFAGIKQAYFRHAAVLDRHPRTPLRSRDSGVTLRRWFREERRAWEEVIRRDPLLPESLWPPGYDGQKAWARRCEIMVRVGERLRAFKAKPLAPG